MKNIVIIDGSEYSLESYNEIFRDEDVNLTKFMHPRIDEYVELFNTNRVKPDLIIIGIVFGGSSEEGYQLLKKLQAIDNLKEIPVIVCSKLINDSSFGKQVQARCRKFNNVVAMYGKIPSTPSVENSRKVFNAYKRLNYVLNQCPVTFE